MVKRYNVSQAKEVPGRDKPVWLRHGIAFEKEGRIRIELESLPIPNKDGEIWLSLFEDTGRENFTRGDEENAAILSDQFKADSAINDDIPF